MNNGDYTMTDMILVYITCESMEQAKTIGKQLMEKRLCACVNIFPEMYPMVFWPPKVNKIEEGKEVVLIARQK
jgi:periplasmic divalent cation tolerance protein